MSGEFVYIFVSLSHYEEHEIKSNKIKDRISNGPETDGPAIAVAVFVAVVCVAVASAGGAGLSFTLFAQLNSLLAHSELWTFAAPVHHSLPKFKGKHGIYYI